MTIYITGRIMAGWMSWQTDLTKGIDNYVRKFEDADKHVENINIMRRPTVPPFLNLVYRSLL